MTTKIPMHVQDYTQEELGALPRAARILFASAASAAEFPAPGEPIVRAIQRGSGSCENLDRSKTSAFHDIECYTSKGVAFSAYPMLERDVDVNMFLWRAVHENCFDASEALVLFGTRVFCVSIPEALYTFLSTFTWEEVQHAMFHVLGSIAHSTGSGTALLRRELAPSFYEGILEYISCTDFANACPPCAFRPVMDLVMDRIYALGPWKIDVTLAQLPNIRTGAQESPRPDALSSTLWRMFCDWTVYEHYLCRNGNASRLEALECMATLIASQRHAQSWRTIATLQRTGARAQACACTDTNETPRRAGGRRQRPAHRPPRPESLGSLFEQLPDDIISTNLVPSVLVRTALAASYDDAVDDLTSLPGRDTDVGAASFLDEDAYEHAAVSQIGETTVMTWSLKLMLLEDPVVMKQYYGPTSPVGEGSVDSFS